MRKAHCPRECCRKFPSTPLLFYERRSTPYRAHAQAAQTTPSAIGIKAHNDVLHSAKVDTTSSKTVKEHGATFATWDYTTLLLFRSLFRSAKVCLYQPFLGVLPTPLPTFSLSTNPLPTLSYPQFPASLHKNAD